MKTLTKIADWIVANNYRYWIAMFILLTVFFTGLNIIIEYQ